MNMFKKIATTAALAAALVVGSLHATPITGGLTIDGTFSLDTNNPADATALGSGLGFALNGEGSYLGTDLSLVQFNGFTFAPFTTEVTPLWSFTSSGNEFSFDLTSVIIADQNPTFLSLKGLGMLHITGLEDTLGTWALTVSNSNGANHATFGFTSTNNAVPDSGTTTLLVGLGLAALGFAARRKS